MWTSIDKRTKKEQAEHYKGDRNIFPPGTGPTKVIPDKKKEENKRRCRKAIER